VPKKSIQTIRSHQVIVVLNGRFGNTSGEDIKLALLSHFLLCDSNRSGTAVICSLTEAIGTTRKAGKSDRMHLRGTNVATATVNTSHKVKEIAPMQPTI